MFPASLAFSFCCRGDREQRRLAKQFQTACEHARYEVEALDGPARLTIDLAVRRENCTGPNLAVEAVILSIVFLTCLNS